MEEISNNKKRNLVIIASLVLVVGLLAGTYAFFNYTKTGSSSSLSTSLVDFTFTDGNLIDVSNEFPLDENLNLEDLTAAQNAHNGSLSITGHTTLAKGVDYKIYVVHGDDINNKIRLNDSNIKFQLEPDFTSGQNGFTVKSNDYSDPTNLVFDNEGKALISTGLIKGTTQQTTVNYNYHFWIDGGSINISSTTKRETLAEGNPSLADSTTGNTTATRYMRNDNTEASTVTLFPAETNQVGKTIYTTYEFSNGYYNLKILVEAIEHKENAFDIVAKNVDTTAQINFANAASANNGEGLYILPGTESDTNPIYYYRGEVTDNNVIFGGFCWQIVRTTDTGGIKMIYNGLPDISGSGANITYNCGTTRDIQDTIRTTTSLGDSTGYYYADDYEIVSTSGNSVTYKLKSKTNPITQVAIADATAASTNIPTIVANYPYTCKQTTETATCTRLYKVDSYASGTNANVYSSLDRPIIGRSAFNSSYESVSDVGYMSNTRYPYSISNWTTNALFASDAMWVNDHYELTDASVTTPDTTHHYSCNATSADATCTSLRYVYYVNGTTKYYITLTNGDLIEDALYKMTGNGSSETKTKNASYVLNVNNSTAKTAIDNWFRTNLTSEVNASNPDYSIYLEDTVYCNDRSYKTTGSRNTYNQSGWNKGGGSLLTYLYFGTHNRYINSWYSTTNVPSMMCPNESDRFTVSNANGNGALTYPVGLLTADEIILAGVGGNNGSTTTYYLYTNDYYWSLSPYNFYSAFGFSASSSYLDDDGVSISYGLRPVVSLRPGTEFEKTGDGTPTNPYVVKYN